MIKQFKRNPEYFVSDKGEVYRVKKLKPHKNRQQNGYYKVHIKINGKRKDIYVHRLVVEVFKDVDLKKEEQINHSLD